MTVEFELWQLISLAVSIAVAFVGLGKLLLVQITRNVERALGQIKEDSLKWRDLERDFLRHLAELPVHYVRREDYVRGQTVIESKLDALFQALKTAELKAAERRGES